jgi:GNAT superfamily N-acetyltransferase
MQLTIVPGLFRGGATRLLVEGIRVASSERSRGIGTAMLEWAHDHGRNRGATLAQIAVDPDDERVRTFGARLGYDCTHAGFERAL